MTSTADLIALLDVEAEEFAESTSSRTTLGIAVRAGEKGLSKRIAKLDPQRLVLLLKAGPDEGIVWAHDKNRQAVLDSFVKAGGEPFGWIRLTNDGSKVTTFSAPFDEFIGDPTARIDRRRICRLDPQRLLDCVSDGHTVGAVRYFEDHPAWMQ